MAALDQYLRTTRIVAVGMVAALIVYAGVVELLRTRLTSLPAPLPPATVRTLRRALLAVALGQAALIPTLRRALLTPRPGAPAAGPRLQTVSIAVFAMCESVGVYGVVLFVLSRATIDFYPFFVLALGLFAVHFPRRERWDQWARQMTTPA